MRIEQWFFDKKDIKYIEVEIDDEDSPIMEFYVINGKWWGRINFEKKEIFVTYTKRYFNYSELKRVPLQF